MSAAEDEPGSVEPVERFVPTSGRLVGYVSLAVIAGLVVYLAVNVQTATGLRLGSGLLFAGVLVWVTQLRPRATAYPETLHLKNSLRDATVPLVLVDEVSVRRMLVVRVGDERYVCIGIGTPLRTIVKGGKPRGPSALLGWDRLESYTEAATPHLPDQSALSYPDFVESRIVGLVEEARRRSARSAGAAPDAQPRRHWAWPEIVALAATGAAFVLSLLV